MHGQAALGARQGCAEAAIQPLTTSLAQTGQACPPCRPAHLRRIHRHQATGSCLCHGLARGRRHLILPSADAQLAQRRACLPASQGGEAGAAAAKVSPTRFSRSAVQALGEAGQQGAIEGNRGAYEGSTEGQCICGTHLPAVHMRKLMSSWLRMLAYSWRWWSGSSCSTDVGTVRVGGGYMRRVWWVEGV